MEVANFKFHYFASVAFDQLPLSDRAELVERLQSLAGIPAADWPNQFVKKMPNDSSLYLLLVNANWRAFLRAVEGEKPEVRDIVRREVLEMFAKNTA